MPITEPRTPDCHFLRLLNMNKKLLFYLALAIVLLDFYVKSFKILPRVPRLSRPGLNCIVGFCTHRWIMNSILYNKLLFRDLDCFA